MNELLIAAAIRRGTQTEKLSDTQQNKIRSELHNLLQTQRQQAPAERALKSTIHTVEQVISSVGGYIWSTQPPSNDTTPIKLKPFRTFAYTHIHHGNVDLNRQKSNFVLPQDVYIATYAGDELWTRENQVQMQCFRGQVVEFKPQTRVLLEQLLRQGEQTRVELRLLIGQLTAKITRVLSDLDAFVVHTPAAHIFTKGAEYSVQVVSPKQTYCEVSQGAMTVISGTSQIQVNAGQALNVELGEPLRPLKLEALQRGYIYLAQQNDQLDKLALRFNCNLNLLRLANPHVSSGEQLCPGTMLLIPQAISEYSQ